MDYQYFRESEPSNCNDRDVVLSRRQGYFSWNTVIQKTRRARLCVQRELSQRARGNMPLYLVTFSLSLFLSRSLALGKNIALSARFI